MPANFGRRTVPTREALSSGFRFSTPLLLRPLSNEKARTRSDETLAGSSNLRWIATEFRNGFFSEGLLFVTVSCGRERGRNLDLEKFRKILIRNGVEMDNSSKIQSVKAVL